MIKQEAFPKAKEEEFTLKPSNLFLEQLDEAKSETAKRLEEKLRLLKGNPYRYKSILRYGLFLCGIRFAEQGKEKRLVCLVQGRIIKIPCILDRKKTLKNI